MIDEAATSGQEQTWPEFDNVPEDIRLAMQQAIEQEFPSGAKDLPATKREVLMMVAHIGAALTTQLAALVQMRNADTAARDASLLEARDKLIELMIAQTELYPSEASPA